MDVLWSDYNKFYRRSMCTKATSIYIITARLARINGLEWAKMYGKSPQYTDMESLKKDLLSMLQTTQIEIEQKYFIFLLKSLSIKFTTQLFSTMSIPKKIS